jgi:hypothetical protein
VKKDGHRFWNVLHNTLYGSKENPYILLSSIFQDFFMKDSIDPKWKVVMCYDPRRKKIFKDQDVIDFGASRSINGPKATD